MPCREYRKAVSRKRCACIMAVMMWTGAVQEQGSGVVERQQDWRLLLPDATRSRYSNAQIDDTSGRRRRHYRWRPPLRLELDARFSHSGTDLVGTAGFGFWNAPFGAGLAMIPALPQTLWFFYGSPPHNVPLAHGVPGWGWKAASLDAARWSALAWAPIAPFAILAMQSTTVYRWLWPRIQRSLAVAEALVPGQMNEWRHYVLDWQDGRARFLVDDQLVLETAEVPRGPLGFVAWMDNQYAIATPRGRYGWGLLDVTSPQWLDIGGLSIS